MPPFIPFTKMHGLGNDFVVINQLKNDIRANQLPIKTLSNRLLGIGFDQLLIIEPSTRADFFCRIYNADGHEASQCGNGLRCLARYLYEEKLHPKKQLMLETIAGIYPAEILDFDHIRINMGKPTARTDRIDFKTHQATYIEIGNPHLIIKVDCIDTIVIDTWLMQIANHPDLKDEVNIGFIQIIDPHQIRLRTIERGVGETASCGSNACAAVLAGIMHDGLKNTIEIIYPFGKLHVEWHQENRCLIQTGPASHAFSGQINLDHWH